MAQHGTPTQGRPKKTSPRRTFRIIIMYRYPYINKCLNYLWSILWTWFVYPFQCFIAILLARIITWCVCGKIKKERPRRTRVVCVRAVFGQRIFIVARVRMKTNHEKNQPFDRQPNNIYCIDYNNSQPGTPEWGGQWGPLPPPEIFASLTKLEVILHKADLGYSVTIRQSLYLTSI
jgi:hypothetical protein